MTPPHSVCEVLQDRVVLESECIDRMYLNVYVPQLQRVGGVVWYLRGHLGQRFASTATVVPKTEAFVAAVERFAAHSEVDLVSFTKHQRKDDLTRQYLKEFDARHAWRIDRARPAADARLLAGELETGAALRDGWLFIGDIARMDEDGYFYVIDRKKDVIFMAGYPIYPREIEEVLYEHPGVLEAAVVGVPDWDETNAIRAFVARRAGSRQAPEKLLTELTAHAKKRLPPHAVPMSFALVDKLPRNMLGKVLRRQLAALD